MMSVSVKEVTILIRQGTLIGFEELSERGDQFVAFRGIPYAQPPINDLRFKVSVSRIVFESSMVVIFVVVLSNY